MEYIGILDVPPLRFVLLSVVQTFTLFVAVLLGLKVVGRPVFGEKRPTGPRDSCSHRRSCEFGAEPSGGGLLGKRRKRDHHPFVGLALREDEGHPAVYRRPPGLSLRTGNP